MQQYTGKSILHKIAIGHIFCYSRDEKLVPRETADDVNQEISRFNSAKDAALSQLHQVYEQALREAGEAYAAVFNVHIMMLIDPDYVDYIEQIIRREHVNAEYAVSVAGEHFSDIFARMDDEYMQTRAEDVQDITKRLLRSLKEESENAPVRQRETASPDPEKTAGNLLNFSDSEPVILVAQELTPSETVQMDQSKVLAFVTRYGSSNSHTAILARTMNIPAIVGIDVSAEWQGQLAVVDGFSGTLTIDPDPDYLEAMISRIAQEEARLHNLDKLKGLPTATKSGKTISLCANIGSVSDLKQVHENDAEGIGLFRSEFLYLESPVPPDEETQFNVYTTIAREMGGKKVIFRTLDLGADKQIDYLRLDKEANPAMGYRAIRICLGQPELFRTQLRALLRAGNYGDISIMLPMITSVSEVEATKKILEEVKTDLSKEHIPYRDVPLGIMIETPAAVWISDLLAEEVDFFSIGTNDLIQYALAADRQNHKLEKLSNPHHPAILRAIRTIVDNGHAAHIPVGICGELAADTSMTATFLEMGIDQLSVTPSCILPVREAVRKLE